MLTVTLEDGSTVTLEPQAAIKYPHHFEPASRKIYLKGNAFFKVSKNASRPFYVFSRNVVTHVLGTSFYVKSNDKSKVEVCVKTGRVEVYEGSNLNLKSTSNGVVLIPNQKSNFLMKMQSIFKKCWQINLCHYSTRIRWWRKKTFIYEDAPLQQVLTALSKAYGIEIMVENENLNNCPFTGDITQQDLYKKLDIICQVIKAAYEVKGTTILIRGKGCAE